MTLFDVLFVLSLPVLVVNTVTGFVLHYFFLRRMRTGHPETWRRLGSPTMILNNSVGNGLRTTAFVWKREWKRLKDPVVARLVWSARVVMVVQVLALGTSAAGLA